MTTSIQERCEELINEVFHAWNMAFARDESKVLRDGFEHVYYCSDRTLRSDMPEHLKEEMIKLYRQKLAELRENASPATRS